MNTLHYYLKNKGRDCDHNSIVFQSPNRSNELFKNGCVIPRTIATLIVYPTSGPYLVVIPAKNQIVNKSNVVFILFFRIREDAENHEVFKTIHGTFLYAN